MRPVTDFPADTIAAFCHTWGVAEFSLFGSVLRDDFGSESDVDVLVAYLPGRAPGVKEWLAQREQLRQIFGGREVDLVERRAVVNPFRRHEILTTRKVLYAA